MLYQENLAILTYLRSAFLNVSGGEKMSSLSFVSAANKGTLLSFEISIRIRVTRLGEF
jgi:hypothetical protein